MNRILRDNLVSAKNLVEIRTKSVETLKSRLVAAEVDLQEAEEAVRFLERGVQ